MLPGLFVGFARGVAALAAATRRAVKSDASVAFAAWPSLWDGI